MENIQFVVNWLPRYSLTVWKKSGTAAKKRDAAGHATGGIMTTEGCSTVVSH